MKKNRTINGTHFFLLGISALLCAMALAANRTTMNNENNIAVISCGINESVNINTKEGGTTKRGKDNQNNTCSHNTGSLCGITDHKRRSSKC